MKTDYSYPDNIKAVLLDSDISLLKLVGESHHALYQSLCRAAMRISQLDSFYIGFYCGDNMMVFPYSFDGQEYCDPNKFKYSPDGLSNWILKNKKPYRFKQDDGFLLNKGKSFGQLDKRSEDALVVPIFEAKERDEVHVIGVMSMQSYRPESYDEVTLRAFEWLANSLALVQERERIDNARRQLLSGGYSLVPEPMLRPTNIVNQMLEKMQSIRRKAEGVRASVSELDADLLLLLDDLIQECHQRQTETIEIFLEPIVTKDTPLCRLSDQEKRVVFLLVEGYSGSKKGYSNTYLSYRLHISENTVKTHLTSIRKKMGVSDRLELVELVKNYLPNLPS